ncbi:MAG: pyridoxal phosphate-dependent aminotransferase [Thermoprotei archaeon]
MSGLEDKRLSERVKKLPVSAVRILSDSVGASGIIRLTAGDPDFKTPKHIVDAALREAEDGLTHYTPSAGLPSLREAIARKLRVENGVSYDPAKQVAVTNGGTGALALTFLALLNPADRVLIPDPGWTNYKPMIIAAGGEAVGYSLRREEGFRPNISEIEALINDRTKVIVVNTPSNPTGAVYGKDVLGEIVDLALKRDLYIISDEVYEKIIFDGHTHVSVASLPGAFERTITVNSFSKTYAMTGWRVGYAAGPEDVISGVSALNSALNSCPSSVSQAAAIAAINGSQDEVDKMVQEYRRRRDYFTASLNELPGVEALRPSGAFYAFADFSSVEKLSVKMAQRLLREAHVAGIPGSAFGEYGEGYIRFSFASSMEELRQAVNRMAEMLRKT